MKKWLGSLAVALITVCGLCMPVQAESGKIMRSGDYRYIQLSDTEVSFYADQAAERVLVVPEQIDGKTVVEVAMQNRSLYSVSMPDTVTRIITHRKYGYQGSLTEIRFSNNLQEIGDRAFRGVEMESLVLPESLRKIGMRAFADCEKLTSVYLPENLESIGAGVFVNCKNLKSVTISPKNQHFVLKGGVLFTSDMKTLVQAFTPKADYTVPDGVETIGRSAFAYQMMNSITLPDTVKTIEPFAFRACTAKTIEVPDSVSEIGYSAFCESGIESFTVPSNVTVLRKELFFRSALKTISIGGQVKRIKYSALACDKLKSVSIPKKTKIEYNGIAAKTEADGHGWYSVINKKCTVYSFNGSKAKKYAKENEVKFKFAKSIEKAQVSGVQAKKYNGKKRTQNVKVLLNGKKLKKDDDYTVTYKNNKKRGKATIVINGAGAYYGKVKKTFRIK